MTTNTTTRSLALIAFTALAAVSQSASAAVLAGWDFSPLTGSSATSLAATTQADNLTVGNLTRGSGINTPGNPADNAFGGRDVNSANFAAAVTGNKFVSLGITADPDYTVSFSDIASYNIRRANTGATTGQWQYQLGSGSFVDIGSAITWGVNNSASGNTQPAIDLSGISALQNVAAGTTVTFRVVTWGGTAGNGTWYLNDPLDTTANDFIINGSVAEVIPEPTVALLGAFGFIVLLRRRRR